MNDHQEELGQSIDRLDSIAHALEMPLPDKMHVDVLRGELPDLVRELKQAFVKLTGENPWSE